MDREQIILACLAPGRDCLYEPVQLQKLLFVFQRKAPTAFGDSSFNFYSYDYGPFDPGVYNSVESLARKGLVQILGKPFDRKRFYKLTEAGIEEGNKLLESFDEPCKAFIIKLSNWVRSLTFAQLVGAIYKAFPEMRANSVFQG